jgi:tetratricopeptide (TPR) repeat protein
MPNRSTDTLFQLIHSLQKAEKRAFKLYIKRNSSNEDLKIIHLFDALDKMSEYDEASLLKRLPSIKKQQLSNIKAHLYKQVLASLRLLKTEDHIDIQLHEQLDYARILYDKGLYLQSLKILERIKELALSLNQDGFLVQIISLEKKIETLHITRSMQDRADQLAAEANEINEKRRIITRLSNLALQLYSFYIQHGHARNEDDEEGVKEFFFKHLPDDPFALTGFYERLYLYQSYCWYAFIRQDFLMYYRYTQKWVELFHEQPQMMNVEPGHYIKGLHNLLNAHFDLRNYSKFRQSLEEFEKFAASSIVQNNDNNKIQTFTYLTTARINQHFMVGTFHKGLEMVKEIEEKLEDYSLYLDRHRILVFYYKIASLYFGSGNYEKTIDYLQKIINWKVDLRLDLQCYARLLHLLAHYELGNFELMEYLTKSVYRFMAKMQNLTVIEEEMFKFLRQNFHLSPRQMKPQFENLLQRIKQFEKNRFETRAFAYLDIISWLESKVYSKPLSVIIHDKYMHSKRGGNQKSRIKEIMPASIAS